MLTAVATVPVLAATAITLVFAAMESAGRTPLSYTPPSNVAEAAGLGMAAEVLRFLRAGDNPQDVYSVRPDIISASVTRATALEAAVWSRRVELVRLMDREGAIPASARPYLACLAAALRTEDIAAYLAPPAGGPECDTEAVYRAIEARSKAQAQ